ncbi:MAG: hypothetical protein PHF60_03720 [Candidatus ainarchaeum sp.]|nr:hypothetical protein [Candidatus ainarchaeum sp.]
MKGPLIAVALLLAIIIGYTLLTMPHEAVVVQEKKPFRFEMSVEDYGLLDNEEDVRGYVTTHVISESAENASVDMLLLGKETKSEIYEIIDYRYGDDKQKTLDAMEASLAPYGLSSDGIYLEDALTKRNSVIIIASDAMPDRLASGDLLELMQTNVVIYLGKPLDVSMDESGAQNDIGDVVYNRLNVTRKGGVISAKPKGPQVETAGDATVLGYGNGWLVLYDTEAGPELGEEIADIILREGWQSERTEDTFRLPDNTSSITLFSSSADPAPYYIRLLYNATSENESKVGRLEIGEVKKEDGLLLMDETRGSDGKLDYTFELHSNDTYPVTYDFKLLFMKDGGLVDTVPAKTVTMKTFSRESGAVEPNISSGSYIVRLADQEGNVWAAAYTHVPKVKVKLDSIIDTTHTFLITVDDQPAESMPIVLSVNNKENFTIKTDEDGMAKASFVLAPGTHTFTAYVNGESGSTRYAKKEDNANTLLYGGLALGSVLLLAIMAFGSRGKRKWAIKTYHRPSMPSKVLEVPYETFLDLFGRSQEDRANGLPLSISDLRIGLRKHATYNGAPLFVTDSNLYTLLDAMVKKGKFLSYGGYFLPAEMARGKPIEYWVLRRRLNDHFVEKGEEPETAKGADFVVGGRMVHIWHEPDAKKLMSLCRKNDNVIIFPNEKEKQRFIEMLHRYDPAWMKLSLELQYGRLYCQTINEFLERGLHAKS